MQSELCFRTLGTVWRLLRGKYSKTYNILISNIIFSFQPSLSIDDEISNVARYYT